MLDALQGTASNYTVISKPSNYKSNPTVISAPQSPSTKDTQIVTPQYLSSLQQTSQTTKSSGDWKKTFLMGSIVGVSIIISTLLIREKLVSSSGSSSKLASEPTTTQSLPTPSQNPLPKGSPQEISDKSERSSPNNQKNVPSPEPASMLSQLSTKPPVPSQPIAQPIGWMRLGTARTTTGFVSIGDPLIATTQPITVTPMIIPEVGSEVVTITGVNIRENFPQAPYYKLPNKLTTLPANQRLRILRVETFVDTNSSSPYTVVWAQVGLPQTNR